VRETMTTAKKIKVTCDKCSGKGHLSYHMNVENGICFPCKGTGKILAYKNDRKPGFDWDDYHSKRIMFIVNATTATIEKMTVAQCNEMDRYVFAMTMNRTCMWLYHFYRESLRPTVINKLNSHIYN